MAFLHKHSLSSLHANAVAHHRTAWLSSISTRSRHFTQTLLHTTATFSTALAPAAPGFQLAIHRAWLKIALLQSYQWQTCSSSIRMDHHFSVQLLLAICFVGCFTFC